MNEKEFINLMEIGRKERIKNIGLEVEEIEYPMDIFYYLEQEKKFIYHLTKFSSKSDSGEGSIILSLNEELYEIDLYTSNQETPEEYLVMDIENMRLVDNDVIIKIIDKFEKSKNEFIKFILTFN